MQRIADAVGQARRDLADPCQSLAGEGNPFVFQALEFSLALPRGQRPDEVDDPEERDRNGGESGDREGQSRVQG